MKISLSLRRTIAQVLVAAILLQLMSPAAAAWFIGGSEWIEICTTAGLKRVDPAPGNEAPKNHASSNHCALCSVSGALPEFNANRYLVRAVVHLRTHVTHIAAPAIRFAGHEIHSRAPPRVS